MILYADILLAINFSMDFLSLFLCSIFLHLKVRKLRIILSSMLGALYALLQMVVTLNGASSIIVCTAVALMMVIIAFPYNNLKQTGIRLAIYLFVSTALGGIMSLVYTCMNKILSSYIENYSYEQAYDTARLWIIISLTAIISVVFSRIIVSKKEDKTAEISVEIGVKKYNILGLVDSGNLLKDPLSGKSVVLVSNKSEIGAEIEKFEDIYKKYIPYSDIDGEGLLKGIVPNEILVNGTSVCAIIATVKSKDFGGYDALVPRALI